MLATARCRPTAPIPDIAAAELDLVKAEALLALMEARVKGGVPPHSQAAQQIRNQKRVVETARLKLEQARKRQAEAMTGATKAAA